MIDLQERAVIAKFRFRIKPISIRKWVKLALNRPTTSQQPSFRPRTRADASESHGWKKNGVQGYEFDRT